MNDGAIKVMIDGAEIAQTSAPLAFGQSYVKGTVTEGGWSEVLPETPEQCIARKHEAVRDAIDDYFAELARYERRN